MVGLLEARVATVGGSGIGASVAPVVVAEGWDATRGRKGRRSDQGRRPGGRSTATWPMQPKSGRSSRTLRAGRLDGLGNNAYQLALDPPAQRSTEEWYGSFGVTCARARPGMDNVVRGRSRPW